MIDYFSRKLEIEKDCAKITEICRFAMKKREMEQKQLK